MRRMTVRDIPVMIEGNDQGYPAYSRILEDQDQEARLAKTRVVEYRTGWAPMHWIVIAVVAFTAFVAGVQVGIPHGRELQSRDLGVTP